MLSEPTQTLGNYHPVFDTLPEHRLASEVDMSLNVGGVGLKYLLCRLPPSRLGTGVLFTGSCESQMDVLLVFATSHPATLARLSRAK